MAETDVIVVGAGLSGLSAAQTLRQRGLKVVVLEATERVGGRVETLTPVNGDPNYGWADLGAAFVGSNQSHVMRMCKELGLATYECSDEFKSMHYSKGKRYFYGDVLPKLWGYNPLAAWDLAVMVRRLEKMCWEIPADKPWEAPHAKEWDHMTVKQFYDKHCWTKYCKEYLMSLSTMDCTADAGHMSLLFYLWYMRQANGNKQLWGWEEGADGMKIVGGSQQIAVKLAQKMGKAVILGKPVVLIKHSEENVMVQTLDGKEYKAKFIIIAIPPVTQMKINFEPALPWTRNCLIQRSPMGLVMKCTVFYREPFWENNGFNGFVGCSDGVEVVGMVFDDQKPGSKLFGLACFVFTKQMVKLAAMTDEMKQESVCRSLAKFYNSEECLKPVKFLYKIWPDEEFICGGYTCYYPPGALSLFGPAMRAPIASRVFLAGTETATHWVGYMSGAIDAGQRAAREVLHASGKLDQGEIWIQESSSTYQPTMSELVIPSIDLVVNILRWFLLALVLSLMFFVFS